MTFNTKTTRRLILTKKQVEVLLSSLQSTAGLRSLEKDRAYIRKIIKEIQEQAP